jgi:hypothetical protein
LPKTVTTGVAAASSAAEVGVVLGRDALAAGRAEGREAGVRSGTSRMRSKKSRRAGSSRATALDEVDPEGVEAARDGDLVVAREADALALGAVAQGGVVQLDADAAQGRPGRVTASARAVPLAARRRPRAC